MRHYHCNGHEKLQCDMGLISLSMISSNKNHHSALVKAAYTGLVLLCCHLIQRAYSYQKCQTCGHILTVRNDGSLYLIQGLRR